MTDTQRLDILAGEKIPIKVNPGNSVKFQVTFTPVAYGNITAHILIKLNSSKCYFYKVKAFGVENSYEIRPIQITVKNYGTPNVIPVEVRNPSATQSLVLYCAQIPDRQIEIQHNAYKGYEPSCCPCSPFLTIPPLKKVRAFNIAFTMHNQNYIYLPLRIRGLPNFNITMPVIIKGASEYVAAYPSVLDFGTLTVQSKPHRLKVRLDTTMASVIVNGILYKLSSNFVLNFNKFPQYPFTLPQSQKPVTIGYVAFYASKIGIYEGRLYIHTNSSETTVINLRAEVVAQQLAYTAVDTSIDTTFAAQDKTYAKDIFLTSNTKEPLIFGSTELSLKSAQAEITCPSSGNLKDNEGMKKCIKTLVPGQRDSITQIRYWSINDKELPLSTYVSLLAETSLIHIPIVFFDSSLFCSYYDYTNRSSYRDEPLLVHRKCNEVEAINLGGFSDEIKAIDLNITNLSPVNMTVSHLALQYKSTFSCFEVVGVYDSLTGEKKYEYASGKIHKFRDSDELVINTNTLAAIRIYLSRDNCNIGEVMRISDNESFTNWFIIRSGPKDTKIKLQFRYHSGEFSFSPSKMRFEPGFAGTYQSKELRAISTFKVPLNIIKTWSSDKRIELSLNLKTIKSESKTEIGVVSFAPGNTIEEQNFLELQNSILSWTRSAITLKELKLWRERQTMWDRISNLGGTVIDVQIYIETDMLQNVKLPVKAELTQPILVQENEVNFKLAQNGTFKKMSIQIYNPSTEALTIQLFAADSSMANYKAFLPLNINTGIQCKSNFSQWVNRYNLAIKQLERRERLTEFRSYDEFSEEYCSCTGKYNASVLYQTDIEEHVDGKSFEAKQKQSLVKLCNGKEVASLSEGVQRLNFNDIHDPEQTRINSRSLLYTLWNFIFPKAESFHSSASPAPVTSGYFSFPITFAQYPLVVDALSYFTIGPITYNPTTIGEHSTLIFIKNNLTVLYPIKLKGESGIGTLRFIEEINHSLKTRKKLNIIPKEHFGLQKNFGKQEYNSVSNRIEINFAKGDLIALSSKNEENTLISNLWSLIIHYLERLDRYDHKVKTIHDRVYIIKNTGNMPITVDGISIDNRGCSGYGITIKNCKEFTLQPGETHKIALEYSTQLAISFSKRSLVFMTRSGPQTFEFNIYIPGNTLYSLQRLPAIEK